jgi:hypothetical protein
MHVERKVEDPYFMQAEVWDGRGHMAWACK